MDQYTKHHFSSKKCQQTASTLIDQANNIIIDMIMQEDIAISNQQKQFHLIKKQQVDVIQERKKKLQQIDGKKKQILQQLQNLKKQQQEQSKIIKNANHNGECQKKLLRSELSSEDKQRLRNLTIARKKFERQLKLKTKKIQEEQKKIKQEKQYILNQQKQQRRQKRKIQAQKGKQQIQNRQIKRNQENRHQSKDLSQVKRRKKVYQQLKNKWKQIEEDEQKKKKQLVDQLKKLKAIDFQDIKEHQRKYQQLIREQRQSRFQRFSRVNSQQKVYKSSFFQFVHQEQLRRKQIEQKKRKQSKYLMQKRLKYAQQVLEQHKPKIKLQQIKCMQKGNQNGKKSLSFLQTHKKGVGYMRQINQNLKKYSKENDQPVQIRKPRYKNYLPEVRMNKNDEDKNQIDEITKIIKKQSLGSDQKFILSRILTQKIQNKNGVHNTKNLMQSINAKLMILRQIQE